MENRHFIIVGIAIIVVLYLLFWENNGGENFTTVPDWKMNPYTYWNPWHFYDNSNSYHPIVPSIMNYNTDTYRFPDTSCLKHNEVPNKTYPEYPCYKPAQMQPFTSTEVNENMLNPDFVKGSVDYVQPIESFHVPKVRSKVEKNAYYSGRGSYNTNDLPHPRNYFDIPVDQSIDVQRSIREPIYKSINLNNKKYENFGLTNNNVMSQLLVFGAIVLIVYLLFIKKNEPVFN